MVKRFLRSGRSGFYLAVVREGDVAPGMSLAFVGRDDHGVTVAEVAALYAGDVDDEGLVRRAIEVPALSEGWKEHFRKRLRQQHGRPVA
jgi:MOSC domain-containing protein YiiM